MEQIKRLPGEKFADFTARQREHQRRQRERHQAEIRSVRALRAYRRSRAVDEGLDHDHSMDG